MRAGSGNFVFFPGFHTRYGKKKGAPFFMFFCFAFGRVVLAYGALHLTQPKKKQKQKNSEKAHY